MDQRYATHVEQLLQARRTGQPIAPPSTITPELGIPEAYQVQHAVIAARNPLGAPVRGYKVALLDPPIFGEILADDVVLDGGTISLATCITPKIEPELAFVFGENIAGSNLLLTDVLAATRFVLPAFEFVDSRIDGGLTNPTQDPVCDNGLFTHMVLGSPVRRIDTIDPRNIAVTVTIDGTVADVGSTSRATTHPAHAVLQLLKHLDQYGRGLKPGDVVLSGTCTPPLPVIAGNYVVAEFAGLGHVSVTFSP
jgi:2-keto-4-pentenoate hydratase